MSRQHPGVTEHLNAAWASISTAKATQEFRMLDPPTQRMLRDELWLAVEHLERAIRLFHEQQRKGLPAQVNRIEK